MANPLPDARVNAGQVREIISTSLPDGQINAFINTAHRLVDDRLSNKGMTAALLGEIELWLAAHFLSMRDQRKKQVKVGDTSVTFQGESGMGLNATSYGQQAALLDYSGSLAALGLRKATLQASSEE